MVQKLKFSSDNLDHLAPRVASRLCISLNIRGYRYNGVNNNINNNNNNNNNNNYNYTIIIHIAVTILFLSSQTSITMATDSHKVPINGHNKQKESDVVMTGPHSKTPLIDDSLIVDDSEGFPLISAVYSLATDGKSDGASSSG